MESPLTLRVASGSRSELLDIGNLDEVHVQLPSAVQFSTAAAPSGLRTHPDIGGLAISIATVCLGLVLRGGHSAALVGSFLLSFIKALLGSFNGTFRGSWRSSLRRIGRVRRSVGVFFLPAGIPVRA